MGMNRRSARALVNESLKLYGYFRLPNQARLEDGPRLYKKGYECRLSADSKEEAERLIQALESLGIRPGKPFAKHRQVVVPVYGLEQIRVLIKPFLRGRPPEPNP